MAVASLETLYKKRNDINKEMLEKAGNKDLAYKAWKIGEPYLARSLHCADITFNEQLSDGLIRPAMRDHVFSIFYNNTKKYQQYTAITASSLTLFSILAAGLLSPIGIGLVAAAGIFPLSNSGKKLIRFGMQKMIRKKLQTENTMFYLLKVLWHVILETLHRLGQAPAPFSYDHLGTTPLGDSAVRIFINDANIPEATGQAACSALSDLLLPIQNQNWIIISSPLINKKQLAEQWQDFCGRKKKTNRKSKKISYSIPFYQKQEKILLKQALQKDCPAYPVPTVFSSRREYAETFLAVWEQFIAPGRLLGVRSQEYQELIPQYRGKKTLPIHATLKELWQ